MRNTMVKLAWLGGGALLTPPPAHAAEVVITIKDRKFEPARAEARIGDTTRWVNEDILPHTATGKKAAFDSGTVAPGASFRYLARRPGRISYSCVFHPTMKGELRVKP